MRLAFYGDDFTGSTDALEVLAGAGLRTALFLQPPDAATRQRFGELDVIGVAGDSRALTPAQMDAQLPAVFAALARCGAPLVHYKVCSTFDSAPGVGSIGRAMELARAAFGEAPIPVLGATPALQRYCAFGNLFARSASDDRVHRIDRHPIMRAHPVTPMAEGDLRLHLGRQTALPIELLPLPAFEQGRDALETHWHRLAAGRPGAVLIDGTTRAHLLETGRLLDSLGTPLRPRFVVGPSGVGDALVRWWRDRARLPARLPSFEAFAPAERVLAVSGSASSLSARQIDAAVQAGYVAVAVDAEALLDDTRCAAVGEALVHDTALRLARGEAVLLHSARGPDDPRIAAGVAALQAQGLDAEAARHAAGRRLAERLGAVTRAVLQRVRPQRLLLSGGDTSSAITQALAPTALLMAARLVRGAPLCRMVADDPAIDGLEVALKGGQMGDTDFFEQARRGRAAQPRPSMETTR